MNQIDASELLKIIGEQTVHIRVLEAQVQQMRNQQQTESAKDVEKADE